MLLLRDPSHYNSVRHGFVQLKSETVRRLRLVAPTRTIPTKGMISSIFPSTPRHIPVRRIRIRVMRMRFFPLPPKWTWTCTTIPLYPTTFRQQ